VSKGLGAVGFVLDLEPSPGGNADMGIVPGDGLDVVFEFEVSPKQMQGADVVHFVS
jgi:hypothetical protein